jgi:HAD superfamily hydrolase (TIGR01509 family)
MQAILFDLWETLITDAPELQRARQLWRAANVKTIFDAEGLTVETDVLDKALYACLRGLSSLHDQGKDTDAAGRVGLFLEGYAGLGGELPGARTHDALFEAICTMPEGLYPRAMEGVQATLESIKAAGLKMGLISNAGVTSAPTLREMLTHYGLLQHLDVCVFSDELKLAKPSAAMFATALDALGCTPAEAVFVGDSPLHDVAGAVALGITAVQIGSKQVEGIKPDFRIETLAELPGVLEQLGQLTPSP